jgi:adenylate cyclase
MHGRIVGGESLTDILKIGQMVTEITIVMADIKNFSALVKASRPDDVNEIFSKYYRVAKDIVFSHGGTLDKFIGDATVAIFGYPYPDEAATLCAMKAAQEIISAGSGLLADLLDRINEKIETGTRVGIATNDLYPIDIASDGVEVSFVGNAMNLAARLQKESDVDGILLDNRTRNLARRFDPAFVDALNLVERVLPVEAVKGQNHPIRAWQATA